MKPTPLTALPLAAPNGAGKERILEFNRELNQFLAGVEKRAFRIAWFAVRHREEALDIVQDAMLSLAQRYADRATEEWPRLFHTILQNRIRDSYRRSKVRNALFIWLGFGREGEDDGNALERFPGEAHEMPDRQASGAQTLSAIERAVQKLPLRQQQVFLLRAWEEMDVAETAAVLGITAGSVKTHYSRAVHTLRTLLEGRHENE